MMRSAVDLPQPEGPTRETNSPSATSMSRRSMALVPLSKVLAMALSERSGGMARNCLCLSRKSSADPWTSSEDEDGASRRSGDQLAECFEIDIAARDDGDDGTRAGLSAKCGCNGKGARTFGDHAALFRQHTHRLARFFERDDQRAVDHRFHALPHAGKKALAAGAVDEGCLPVGEDFRTPLGEGERKRRGSLGLDAEDLDRGLQRLERAADTADKSAAADGRDHCRSVRRIFQNLQSHRGVPGDEIVI